MTEVLLLNWFQEWFQEGAGLPELKAVRATCRALRNAIPLRHRPLDSFQAASYRSWLSMLSSVFGIESTPRKHICFHPFICDGHCVWESVDRHRSAPCAVPWSFQWADSSVQNIHGRLYHVTLRKVPAGSNLAELWHGEGCNAEEVQKIVGPSGALANLCIQDFFYEQHPPIGPFVSIGRVECPANQKHYTEVLFGNQRFWHLRFADSPLKLPYVCYHNVVVLREAWLLVGKPLDRTLPLDLLDQPPWKRMYNGNILILGKGMAMQNYGH